MNIDDWYELLIDIWNGFKLALYALFLIVIAGSIIWGVVSVFLILAHKIQFSWWFLPCWVILLLAILGAIGATWHNY